MKPPLQQGIENEFQITEHITKMTTPQPEWKEEFDKTFVTQSYGAYYERVDLEDFKTFISSLLTRQREAIIAAVEKQKWGNPPEYGYQAILMGIDEGATEAHYKEHDKILSDTIEVIKNIT